MFDDEVKSLAKEAKNYVKNEKLLTATEELLEFYGHLVNIPQAYCKAVVEKDGRGYEWEFVIAIAQALEDEENIMLQ